MGTTNSEGRLALSYRYFLIGEKLKRYTESGQDLGAFRVGDSVSVLFMRRGSDTPVLSRRIGINRAKAADLQAMLP